MQSVPPSPPPPPPPLTCGTGGDCLVFLSSESFLGDLGGLAGADGRCQRLAKNRPDPLPPLPGTYNAWLSTVTGTGSESPSTRFVKSPGPYKRVDGVTVASSWTDLTTEKPGGTYLAAAITVTETGGASGSDSVWTFTRPDGTGGFSLLAGDFDCNSWADDTRDHAGAVGLVSSSVTDSTWTEQNILPCDDLDHGGSRLYCFQQS
jgi:hypothetical protein